jgi:fumarate reductase flavoprotein subunit
VSALRLAESGLRVAVLEQGNEERYLCNSRFTGGSFHICFRGITEDETSLRKAIDERTSGAANPQLAQAVARETRTAVQWLKGKGVKFIKGGAEAWRSNMLAPPLPLRAGLHWEGRGGDVMLRTLTAALKALGGSLLLGTRALRLRMEDRRVSGVETEGRTSGVLGANCVVICDGGFQANHALLREFITPAPAKLKQRGAATGHGDGLKMAREAGAKTVGMERFYGHVLGLDAMQNAALWPWPMLDPICTAGAVLDAAGRRFVDEGRGGVHIANSIARLADPQSAVVIFDEAIWNGPARGAVLPANPYFTSAGGTLLKAADLGSLAQQIGMARETLEAAIARHNATVEAGQTQQPDPPRTVSSYQAFQIRQPPFYAARLCAGITFTMGGLAIDGAARVLDEHDRPIPGLYAAGCATGGLEGGEFAGYIGGLAKSSVTALLAANHIAAHQGHLQEKEL